jgi:diacylglycerol O-acyltransferase
MTKHKVSPLDAAWLMLESPETPMHVGTLLEFTAPADAPVDYLRSWLDQHRETRFVPPFNLVPTRGPMPRLKEVDDIELTHHVKLWGLPRPGGQRELGVLVSRLHSRQLDLTRPLWELHIIDGLEDNRFALYYKIHHTLIDGVSGMRHFIRCLSTDPADRDTPLMWEVPRPPTSPRPECSPKGSVRVGLAGLRKARKELKSGKIEGLRAPYDVPDSPLGAKISGRRRFATQSYDLEQFKALARAADCTMNDLVLYLSGSALRTYLTELGGLPEQSLTAGVPVSLRDPGDERPGTAIGFLVAELGTHVADPLERLAAVKKSATVAKEHLRSMPSESLSMQTILVNAPYIGGLLTGFGHRSPLPFSVGISNVPGPDRPLYFNGARLDAMYPVSLLTQGNALNITCVSNDRRLNFGFIGARDALPHFQHLALAMGEALEELSGLLAVQPSSAS